MKRSHVVADGVRAVVGVNQESVMMLGYSAAVVYDDVGILW